MCRLLTVFFESDGTFETSSHYVDFTGLETHCINEAGLELVATSALLVLGLQVPTTTPRNLQSFEPYVGFIS